MRVYFEELRSGGLVAGRSDNNFLVATEGSEELLGRFCDVKVTHPRRMVLNGTLV